MHKAIKPASQRSPSDIILAILLCVRLEPGSRGKETPRCGGLGEAGRGIF